MWKSGLKPFARWAVKNTLYSRALYRPKAGDKPLLLRLDVNNTCNLLCKKCFYPEFRKEKHPQRYMPIEDFRKLAERLFSHAYCLQLACSFEPLLHPEFPAIVEEIDRYAIPSVGMVTNATLLEGERAEAIVRSRSIGSLSISINAIEPDTYAALHGKQRLERVLSNIEAFLDLRGRSRKPQAPLVKINTVLMRSNLAELERLLEWCAKRRVDEVQFFHVEPFGAENDESLAAVPDAYNAARKSLLRAAERHGLALFIPPPMTPEFYDAGTERYLWNHCQFKETPPEGVDGPPPHPYPRGLHCICPWMTLVIDCWGNLYPCAHRIGEAFGNILLQQREEALNTLPFLRLRRAMLRGRHGEACPNCEATTPHSDPMRGRVSRIEFDAPQGDSP